MHRFYRPLLICIAVIIGVSISAKSRSEELRREFHATVRLVVQGPPDSESQMVSYLGRELRSLRDISVVEGSADFILSVMTLQVKTKGGTVTGYAASTSIKRPYDNAYLVTLVAPQSREAAKNMTSSLFYEPLQWLNIGGPNDLQRMCQDIIADFDGQVLESDRKFWRTMSERFKPGSSAKQ